MPSDEKEMIFAIGKDRTNRPILLLGLPEAGWQLIKDGLTQTLDLKRFGLDLTVLLWGGKDRAAIMEPLRQASDPQTMNAVKQFAGTTNALVIQVLTELQNRLEHYRAWTPEEAARLSGRVALALGRLMQDPLGGK